jgi:hypothetical protein
VDLGLDPDGAGLPSLKSPRVRSAHFGMLLLAAEPWPLLINAAVAASGGGILYGVLRLGALAGSAGRLLGLFVGMAIAMPLSGIALGLTAIGREEQLRGRPRTPIQHRFVEVFHGRKRWLMSLLFSTWAALGASLLGVCLVMLCTAPARLGDGGRIFAAILVPLSIAGALLTLAGLLAATFGLLLHAMVAIGSPIDPEYVRSPRVILMRPLDVIRAHAPTFAILLLVMLAFAVIKSLADAAWLLGGSVGAGPELGAFILGGGPATMMTVTTLILEAFAAGALLSYLGGAAVLAQHQLVGANNTVQIKLDLGETTDERTFTRQPAPVLGRASAAPPPSRPATTSAAPIPPRPAPPARPVATAPRQALKLPRPPDDPALEEPPTDVEVLTAAATSVDGPGDRVRGLESRPPSRPGIKPKP